MKDRVGWTVLYLNPATPDLYQVMREETPAGLDLLFLESGQPPEVDAKLPRLAAGTLDAFRVKMRFALGNIARAMSGEEPLERVPGT